MFRSTGTLPHSSFPLPVLISCPAPPSLHHSLCLWLIPLIRLIKQNVDLGQDWLRTGGWRGQDSDCCGAALMMSNGVWSRRWTFSQWAAGGRRGFNRIGLLHGADIVKKIYQSSYTQPPLIWRAWYIFLELNFFVMIDCCYSMGKF